MSKQSEAKAAQGYTPKIIPQSCGNCAHFRSTITKQKGYSDLIFANESNLHCGIGGFAVKKMGSCNEWAGKAEEGYAE